MDYLEELREQFDQLERRVDREADSRVDPGSDLSDVAARVQRRTIYTLAISQSDHARQLRALARRAEAIDAKVGKIKKDQTECKKLLRQQDDLLRQIVGRLAVADSPSS